MAQYAYETILGDTTMDIYEGNEQYIFVSYAHRDSDTVVPIIRALQENGFRVWYDQGIQAGTEWPAYIEDHLNRCSRFVVFMTESTVESVNCRNEINYAAMLKKEMLVIYLEKTTLAYGLNLQLNSKQSLFKYRHTSEEAFLRELLLASILRVCKEGVNIADDAFSSASSHINTSTDAAAYATIDANSKERRDTLLSHAGGEYTIARIGTIGAKNISDLWPTGEYSRGVSLKHFSAVQFHGRLITPSRQQENKVIYIRIYDHNDALVFDNQVTVPFSAGNDKFAVGWTIRDAGGLAQAAGKYTALIWIDNSRVIEHTFYLTEDGGAVYSGSKEAKRIQRYLATPKLLFTHALVWIVYFLFFGVVSAQAGFPSFLFGVLALIVTILYQKKTRKVTGWGRFWTFLLVFLFSFYYGIYLLIVTIVGLYRRPAWHKRLAELSDEA